MLKGAVRVPYEKAAHDNFQAWIAANDVATMRDDDHSKLFGGRVLPEP